MIDSALDGHSAIPSRVKKPFARFREGKFSLEDDPRPVGKFFRLGFLLSFNQRDSGVTKNIRAPLKGQVWGPTPDRLKPE
ncbi:hypothetical protein TNCV_533071 [Trichonephila clavipes]|nr:hypothetical protein TNCV_533071 [Trichonephila clavipes]